MISRIKSTGFKYSLQIIFNRIIPAGIFRCRRFTVFELPQSIERPTKTVDFEIGWTGSDQDRTDAVILSRVTDLKNLDAYRVCIARKGETVVGVAWCAETCFDESELGVRILLEPEQSWLFSAYVIESERRRGVYQGLVSFLSEQLQAKNPGHRILLAINPDNRRSMAAHQSFGIHVIANVFAVRIFKTAFCQTRHAAGQNAAMKTTTIRTWTWNHLREPIGVNLASNESSL